MTDRATDRPGAAGLQFGLMVQPRSLEETAELARRADAAGFAWLGVADSPVVYQDAYLHQAEALRATGRIRVGPLVSHVVLRHPLILGNALATMQEGYGGRTVGVIGSGNSAARGVGAVPAGLGLLDEAVELIRGYWAGRGGSFGATRVPATGLFRQGCPLFIAGDGPRAAALAGRIGDGFVYGGPLEPSVLEARLAAGRRRPDQAAWVAPVPTLAETVAEAFEEVGVQLVAIANRALRGDLDARGVPRPLQADVRSLWRRYDYAFHADSRRPRNRGLVTPALAAYLVDRFTLWGDESRWRARLDTLHTAGFAGAMFILGHDDPLAVVEQTRERLERLGFLTAAQASEPGIAIL